MDLCISCAAFFRKKGVGTMTVKELFTYIVESAITEENKDAYLDKLTEIVKKRDYDVAADKDKVDEEGFMRIYLPKCINEVI